MKMLLLSVILVFAGHLGAAPHIVFDLPPCPGNPRNSEGDFAVLKDGRILFVYTHYTKGNGGDHDPASLAARVSNDGGLTWSDKSVEVIPNEAGMNVMCASLLRLAGGELALFYLRKNSESDCRPVMRVSRDDGKSWSGSIKCVPDSAKGYYVMENCRAEQLTTGRIVLPLALHASKNNKVVDWLGRLVCWYSDDEGNTWRRGCEPFVAFDASGNRLVLQEPGLVELKDGRVLMYARTSHGRQWFFYSSDACRTWSAGRPSGLVGPCSPATIKRLLNGDLVAAWNDHSEYPEFAARDGRWGTRIPASVAISKDDGQTWIHHRVIDSERDGGWHSYFCVAEHNGNLLIGYNPKNMLRHLRIIAVPLPWIYEGEDSAVPRRGFPGVENGPFWGLSAPQGVWSAKRGDAEIYTWNHGKGVSVLGGTNRVACLDIPIGANVRDRKFYAERRTANGPFDFTVAGKTEDGKWKLLFSAGDDMPLGRLLQIQMKWPEEEVTALRFACTSADGVLITD